MNAADAADARAVADSVLRSSCTRGGGALERAQAVDDVVERLVESGRVAHRQLSQRRLAVPSRLPTHIIIIIISSKDPRG